MGRGGEIGSSIWHTCSWNDDTEMWEIEWAEEKTGTVNLMTFSRDNTDLEVDMFHSMACYLITQGGGHKSSDENKFLFPCFANLRKGGASEKVHSVIKSCVGHVPGVTSDMSPSGIRVSASDEMVKHPMLNLAGAIVRGGWAFEKESRLFYYLTKRLHVSQAGLVLSDMANPTQHCPMYRIDGIVEEKLRQKVKNYVHELFGDKIGGSAGIDTIKSYLFASLLFWFDEFNSRYNSTNIVTKRMLTIGRKFGIDFQQLKDWGKAVRDDLFDRSTKNVKTLGDVLPSINDMQSKLVRVLQELKESKEANVELKEKIGRLDGMIVEMHSVIVQNYSSGNQLRPSAESGPKSNKEDHDEDTQTNASAEKKNAYAMLMSGFQKSPHLDHFEQCMQWDVAKFICDVVKEKHNVIAKGISSRSTKGENSRVRKVWRAVLGECNEEEKKLLTFKAACPTPEDSEYQNFVTMLGAMALALQNRLISKKKKEYLKLTGKERKKMKITVSSVCNLLEDLSRIQNKAKKK